MIKPMAAVVAAAALAAGPGCGSDDQGMRPDEREVALVAKTWMTASAKGDGERACRVLTPLARAHLTTLFASCEELVADLADAIPADEVAAYEQVDVLRVRIEGDRARITPDDLEVPERLTRPGEPSFQTHVFRRVDGTWKLGIEA
jgi:hypothetical protein